MKKLELPITRKFATRAVNIHEAQKDIASGKTDSIAFGTIDFGTSSKELDQARAHGGMVIWSASCIEDKLDSLIIRFVFSSEDKQDNKGMQFFANEIVKSNNLSYAAKKGLVVHIVNRESLLKGSNKTTLEKKLKDVMDFRNSFAHGDVIFQEDKGCVLNYWMGGPKSVILNEEYWSKLEDTFKKADELIEKALSELPVAINRT